MKTGLIKPVTAERAVAHSLVKEKGEETLLPPWVRVVLKMKSRRFCFAEGKKKKRQKRRERIFIHGYTIQLNQLRIGYNGDILDVRFGLGDCLFPVSNKFC